MKDLRTSTDMSEHDGFVAESCGVDARKQRRTI